MLECRECRELLYDYYDEEVDDSKRQKVEEHLGKCIGCRREWLEINEVMGRYKSHVLAMNPSIGLVSLIKTKLSNEIDKKIFAWLVGLFFIDMVVW